MNNKQGFPFLVRTVADIAALEEMDKRFVNIYLVNREYSDSIGDYIEEDEVIYLTNNTYTGREKTIYKYQNCEEIIRQFLGYASKLNGKGHIVGRNREMKLWGFYSPIGRCGQTSIAVTMGQLLAKRGKTLYLNLEPYSGLDDICKDINGDLSDLLYILNTDGAEPNAFIGSLSKQILGLDIMCPMKMSEEIHSIDAASWISLFEALESKTDYEYILVELSDSINGFYQCLKMCDKLFVGTLEGKTNDIKIKAFKETMERLCIGINDEKFVTYHVPEAIGKDIDKELNGNIERLSLGEAGKIGRMLIDER